MSDPKKTLKQFKAQMLKLDVNPIAMKQFSKLVVTNNDTNVLNEAPVKDKVYSINGKRYARPLFRLLSNDSERKIPGQEGLRFSKDEAGKLYLNVIVEAYCEQIDVIPLSFKNVKLDLIYGFNGTQKKIPLSITQIFPVESINVLNQIYAQAQIQPEHKEAIYEALVNSSLISKLNVIADLWWQTPNIEKQEPKKPKPITNPNSVLHKRTICEAIDRSSLIVRGNRILIKNRKLGSKPLAAARTLMSFENNSDARKALSIIRHYNFTKKCRVGNFNYFLSGNNAPTGSFKGEDALPFNSDKIQVKKVSKRWKIVKNNRMLFDFGSSKTNADLAFQTIKKYGFDTVCYVGRPRAEMTYLKRTKPVRLKMMHMIKPQFLKTHALGVKGAPAIKPNTSKAPQKIKIISDIHLSFERKNASVFQGFFSELETPEYKWIQGAKIDSRNPNILHSYYYRLTNDPNKVFFLPQVYRIGIDYHTGKPKVNINLYKTETETGETEYRINMNLHMVPYFHPKAKKDLMQELYATTNQTIKYVESLILDGYKDVHFELDSMFLEQNALFSSKYPEKILDINAAEGFTITADHSLESFEDFKNKLTGDGLTIGKVYFDLEEEKDGVTSTTKGRPINVELNFNKLENIPLDIRASTVNSGQQSIISGFELYNKAEVPVNIEGVELTLLSSKDRHIYDIDSELGTTIRVEDWPIQIDTNKTRSLVLDDDDIDELTDQYMIWNKLVCEPYGIYADIDPEVILASVIDHASGDPEIWNLTVVCPLYKNWNEWTDEQRLPYEGIVGLNVDVKIDQAETFSIELNRDNPEGIVKMSRSVKQLLKSTNFDHRNYQYRLTSITLPPSNPGEWIKPETTSINRLRVFPEL